VRVVESDGREVFRRPRGARVVGTRWISTNELYAWGEDGIVELLDDAGNVKASFTAGPPIYADVTPLPSGDIAVIDSAGTAYRLSHDCVEESRLSLGGPPLAELVRGDTGYVFVTVGSSVHAVDFEPD
jgi:hypothetical protein